MTETAYIYGRSDDLIEVEGAVRGEVYANYGESTTVTVGEWVFDVEYDADGIWRVGIVRIPIDREPEYRHHAPDAHQFKEYSEMIEFDVPDDVTEVKTGEP